MRLIKAYSKLKQEKTWAMLHSKYIVVIIYKLKEALNLKETSLKMQVLPELSSTA